MCVCVCIIYTINKWFYRSEEIREKTNIDFIDDMSFYGLFILQSGIVIQQYKSAG